MFVLSFQVVQQAKNVLKMNHTWRFVLNFGFNFLHMKQYVVSTKHSAYMQCASLENGNIKTP